jgi:uncharacterized integral membrane protein
VTLLCLVAIVLFAVASQGPADIGFWPLRTVVEMPLFLAVLAALVLGMFIGTVITWIGHGRWRRDARTRGRRINALESELAATQAQLKPLPARADLGR